MTNYKKTYRATKTTKSERRRPAPHLLPNYNADWWKEFDNKIKSKAKQVVDQNKIRTLDPKKYPQPKAKKRKNEKRHEKTVQFRRKEIEEKGFYFLEDDKACAGKLYRWRTAHTTSEQYDFIRARWVQVPTIFFAFFNKKLFKFSKAEQGIPEKIWLDHVAIAREQGKIVKPETLLKEALFCTGKVVKMRNDSAFPSTIALEVYSVELGFDFVQKAQVNRY